MWKSRINVFGTTQSIVSSKDIIKLLSMGLFGAAHISYNDKTWHSYIFPKEDPKSI